MMINIEKNGIDLPESLSAAFFQKCLENEYQLMNINNMEISITNGSSGGDNYCSQIYRANIKYGENNTISLIIKYIPVTSDHEILIEFEVYKREVKMYNEIIPQMERLFNNQQLIAPKCFYNEEKPVWTIVLQDMTEFGYKLADRINGLDEAHTKIVLQKLAKFHGASMVLAKQNPGCVKDLNRHWFNEHKDNNLHKEVLYGNSKYLENLLYSWPGYESIGKKLQKINTNFLNIAIQILKDNTNIRVINHGDLWVNNVLFKNDKNGPVDVAFIDLQFCYWGSLGLDLHYFLNTSVQIDVLKSKRYELLRCYYTELKSTLEQLKFTDIPSWEDFKNEMNGTEYCGFVALEAILPIILLDRETSKDNSLSTFTDAPKMQRNREISFSSERMIETLKYSLDRLDELGIFDKIMKI